MQARRDKTQHTVVGTAREKAQRDGACGVFFVLVEGTFSQTKRIKKGAKMEVAVRIDQMNAHGRKIRALAVLLDGIVRREESRSSDDSVEEYQDDEPSREFATLRHLALAAVRMRGSAQ
jgi:hypothetical protein